MNRFAAVVLLSTLFISACSDDEVDIYEPDPLVDIDNKFAIKTLWSTNVGEGIGSKAFKISPIAAYDKIYVADSEGKVAAVNPDTGKKIWEKETGLEIAGGPAVGNKLVAFGTSQGDLLVFDAESGAEKWRALVSSEIISSPAIGDGHVAVRTVDGKIYVFDASSGKEKWFYDESLPPLTLRGNASPIIAGGGVISGFSNGKLAVFILENGQLAWEKRIATPIGSSEIQRLVDVDLQPVIIGTTLYVGSYNGNLASINLQSGEFNWQRELSTYRDLGANNLLLFATHENSHLSAINRTNGVIIWTQKELNRRQLTSPGVVDGHLVVGDYEGYVHWLSVKTGKIESRTHIDSSGITANPLVIDDKVILYTRDGSLVAIKKQ